MRIISGEFSGRHLETPSDNSIRPSSDRLRENLFNILSHFDREFFKGKRVLDLFAGTGALGLEALSRGCSSGVFIENSFKGRALIQKNIENLNLQMRAKILRRDATALHNIGRMQAFDLIFADPPYAKALGEKAFISAYSGGWTKKNSIFILEEAVTASINMPLFLKQIDYRVYGQTALVIYTVKEI